VADHRVPDLDVGHCRANLLDPPGVLVSRHVWQERVIRILYRLPLTLDDVYIGAAQSGRTDPDDHVERVLYLRLIYLLDLEAVFGDALVVTVQPRGLHAILSSLSEMP
jgi:hypothetical protein